MRIILKYVENILYDLDSQRNEELKGWFDGITIRKVKQIDEFKVEYKGVRIHIDWVKEFKDDEFEEVEKLFSLEI